MNHITRRTRLQTGPVLARFHTLGDAIAVWNVTTWSWILTIFAFAIFMLYGFWKRPLRNDFAIFAYIDKAVSLGIPPHVAAFNQESSLSFLL